MPLCLDLLFDICATSESVGAPETFGESLCTHSPFPPGGICDSYEILLHILSAYCRLSGYCGMGFPFGLGISSSRDDEVNPTLYVSLKKSPLEGPQHDPSAPLPSPPSCPERPWRQGLRRAEGVPAQPTNRGHFPVLQFT